MTSERVSVSGRARGLVSLAAWGPGLLVMLADNDAGNVATAAQSGARWGYRLLPLLLLLIPMLYMVQELAVRLGIFTGRGFGALVRARFGAVWGGVAAAALGIATLASLITEFTGIAAVGELYSVPRSASLLLSGASLLAVVLTGAYRRVERIAIVIGLFELTFFFVAWSAHPGLAAMARDALDLPLGDRGFLYLSAALIGATFNPWMIFYQQSAMAEKHLDATHYAVARWDTAIGAVLTQALTGAVLVAAAATIGTRNPGAPLDGIGQISEALTPFLGVGAGRLVFGIGVVGAAMVGAIVSSLALAWGLGEIVGGTGSTTAMSGWRFQALYGAGVVAGAVMVWLAPDLLALNIAAQVANAVLLPLVVGLLLILAATVLPPLRRLRGWYLWLVCTVCALVAAAGLIGAAAALV